MLISLFIFVMSLPECRFEKKSEDIFNLTIGKHSVEIPVLEKDARLLKCREWPNIKNWYVAEIDMGTTGTQSKTNSIDLYIVQEGSDNLKLIRHRKIREIERRTMGKLDHTIFQVNYSLKKSSDGSPQIKWSDEKSLESLER